jgi:hypothetical protein
MAASTPQREITRTVCFPLDRRSVMEIGANYAMFLLWRMLSEKSEEVNDSES